ncbi:hypothetical protein [Paenibacillus sp. 32352]|uniref:hypothetical protein n=1 Tax=Paenibacillus sp. 32352 TaxID=1969111 RepID=UPI0009ABCE64|nr:hypothetical protein [Paenibacillus sp. 32352]
MSFVYSLDTSRSKVSDDQIGPIMAKFNHLLYKETGLTLANVAYTHEQAIEALFKSKMFVGEILLEQVLWKNMTSEEKAVTLIKFLNEIEIANEELIIVDNFLFPNRADDDYLDFLIRILNESKVRSLKIITLPSFNKDLFAEFEKRIASSNIMVRLYTTEEFHDRFWLSKVTQKGFKVGPSLNGIGKKIGTIEHLDQDDFQEILSEVNKLTN